MLAYNYNAALLIGGSFWLVSQRVITAVNLNTSYEKKIKTEKNQDVTSVYFNKGFFYVTTAAFNQQPFIYYFLSLPQLHFDYSEVKTVAFVYR